MIDTNHHPLSTWNTCDEIAYLEAIGSHTVLGRSALDRRELLQAYLKVLRFRPRSERYLNVEKLQQKVEELISEQT